MESIRGLLFAMFCVSSSFGATYRYLSARVGGPNAALAHQQTVPHYAGLKGQIKGEPAKRNRAAISFPVDTTQPAVATLITEEINRLRRLPQASNMYKVVWDAELQFKAQARANQCLFTHPNPAERSTKFSSLGQSIYAYTCPNGPISWNATIKAWYDEVNSFTFGVGPKTPNAMVGDYTQLVWAATSAIGCAFAQCGPNTQLGSMVKGTGYFYACNFGEAGNAWPNYYSPYTAGTKCSNCPNKGTCENALCIPAPAPPSPPKTCPYTNYYDNCGVDDQGYPAIFPQYMLPATPNGCKTVPSYLTPYVADCKATCNCAFGTYQLP